MITYIDTDEVEDIAKELAVAAKDLGTEFNTLYKRLSNVPTVTKEWIGNQANFYFSKVAMEKQQYTNLVNRLTSISHELHYEAANAQSQIKTNNNKA